MQKFKIVDGSVYKADSVEIVKGNLEIVFSDNTAEEVQEIFKDQKANLSTIVLLTESGEESGYLYDYVCYSGLFMVGDSKKITLTKETDKDSIRLTNAEAAALEVKTLVSQAETNILQAQIKLEDVEAQITDTQLAVVELYESIMGGA